MNQILDNLGVVIDFQTKNVDDVKEATKAYTDLRDSATGASDAVRDQSRNMEEEFRKARRAAGVGLGVATIGIAGVAGLTKMGAAAMATEGAYAAAIAQQAVLGVSQEKINTKTEEWERMINRIGGSIPIPLLEIRDAFAEIHGALGEEFAVAGLENLGKMRVAARGSTEAAVGMMKILERNWGTQWSDLSPLERSDRMWRMLATSTALTGANLDQMERSIKKAAPLASALGFEPEELLSFSGELTRRGLDVESGTLINSLIDSLVKFKEKAKNVIKSKGIKKVLVWSDLYPELFRDQDGATPEMRKLAGLELTDTEGEFLGMTEIFSNFASIVGIDSEKIRVALDENNLAALDLSDAFKVVGLNAQWAAASEKLLTEQGAKAMLIGAGSLESIKANADKIKNPITADAVLDSQLNFGDNQQQMLSNNIESLTVEIGQNLAPTIKDLIGVLKDTFGWLANIASDNPGTTKALTWSALGLSGAAIIGGLATAGIKYAASIKTSLDILKGKAGEATAAVADNVDNSISQAAKTTGAEVARTSGRSTALSQGGKRLLGGAARVAGPLGWAWAIKDYLEGEDIGFTGDRALESQYEKELIKEAMPWDEAQGSAFGPKSLTDNFDIGLIRSSMRSEQERQAILRRGSQAFRSVYYGDEAKAEDSRSTTVVQPGTISQLFTGPITISTRATDVDGIKHGLKRVGMDAADRAVGAQH